MAHDNFKQTIKYLRIPIDTHRTWADIENYSARHSSSAYFGKDGLPELEKRWIEYERE